MGGIPCLVDRQAILRFQAVPTDPKGQAEFDGQMRQLYVAVSQSVANDAPDDAMAVCAILAKPSFDDADRAKLLSVIESLYKPYG